MYRHDEMFIIFSLPPRPSKEALPVDGDAASPVAASEITAETASVVTAAPADGAANEAQPSAAAAVAENSTTTTNTTTDPKTPSAAVETPEEQPEIVSPQSATLKTAEEEEATLVSLPADVAVTGEGSAATAATTSAEKGMFLRWTTKNRRRLLWKVTRKRSWRTALLQRSRWIRWRRLRSPWERIVWMERREMAVKRRWARMRVSRRNPEDVAAAVLRQVKSFAEKVSQDVEGPGTAPLSPKKGLVNGSSTESVNGNVKAPESDPQKPAPTPAKGSAVFQRFVALLVSNSLLFLLASRLIAWLDDWFSMRSSGTCQFT